MSLQKSVESANDSAERQLTASAAVGDPAVGRAAGKAGRKRKKPILIITVDIGAGKTGDINVFEDDKVEDLAAAFCARHDLSEALAPAIAKHIENNVDALKRGELKKQQDEAQVRVEKQARERQELQEQASAAAEQARVDAQAADSGLRGDNNSETPSGAPPKPKSNAPSSRAKSRTSLAPPPPATSSFSRKLLLGASAKNTASQRYSENAKVAKLLGKPIPARVRKPLAASISLVGGTKKRRGKRTATSGKSGTATATNSTTTTTGGGKKRVGRKKKKKRKKRKPKTNAAEDAAITRAKRGGDVYSRLYNNAMTHWNRVDDEKRKDEERKEAEAVGFSYKPDIKPATVAGARRGAGGGSNAGARLHSSGHRFRLEKQEAARRAHEEREAKTMAECTFRPAVNKRSEDLVRRKREALASSSLRSAGATSPASVTGVSGVSSIPSAQSGPGASAGGALGPAATGEGIFGRIYDPPAFSRKVVQLAQQQEEKEMAECTFRPRISERSRRIVERRRKVGGGTKSQASSFRRSGARGGGMSPPREYHQYSDTPAAADEEGSHGADSKFEELYMDARRRREKQDEYVAWKDGQYSFKPDIGINKARRGPDATLGGFYERLHKSGQARAAKIAALRQKEIEVDAATGQRLFQPKVGRAPNFVRNVHGLPVHDFLFASRHEYEDRKRLLEADEMRRVNENFNKSHVTSTSSKLVTQAKERRSVELFLLLTASDPDDFMENSDGNRDATVSIPGDAELDTSEARFDAVEEPALREVVEPMLRRLNGARITFDEFCTLLEREIEDAKSGPILSVLVSQGHVYKNEMSAMSSRARREKETSELTFKPKLNAKSQELASKLGRGEGATMPIHDLLFKQSQQYKANLEMQRKRAAAKEMEECTFKPRLVASSQNYGSIYQRLPGSEAHYHSPTKSSSAGHRTKANVAASPYHDPDVWSPPTDSFSNGTSRSSTTPRSQKKKLPSKKEKKRSPKSKTIHPKRKEPQLIFGSGGSSASPSNEHLVAADELIDNSMIASGQSPSSSSATPLKKKGENPSPKIISGKGKRKKEKARESQQAPLSTASPRVPAHKPRHANASVVLNEAASSPDSDAAAVSEIDKVLADLRSVTAADDSTGYSS